LQHGLAGRRASDKLVDALIHREANAGRQLFLPIAHNPAMTRPH
jgi:hypothetical protein